MTKEQSSPEILFRLKDLYNRLSYKNLEQLSAVYSNDIVFVDPFHRLAGLPALTDHFEKLYRNLLSIHFTYLNELWTSDRALLTWRMDFSHRALKRGEPISVNGATQIEFNDKIFLHHDYFDGAAMVYQHIPIIGTILQWVQKRVSS